MNENQLEALRRLRDEPNPIKLHPSTGRSLSDLGFARCVRIGSSHKYAHRSTERGIEEIDMVERVERQSAVECSLSADQSKFRRTVEDWLALHSDLSVAGRGYARHVANALLAGAPVPESGHKWDEEADGMIRAWVETAIDALQEMAAAKREARETGGHIAVTYRASIPVTSRSASRRVAAVEEAADDNVVGLDRYRQGRLA